MKSFDEFLLDLAPQARKESKKSVGALEQGCEVGQTSQERPAGQETEPWEIVYFKLYKSQMPVVETLPVGLAVAWAALKEALVAVSRWLIKPDLGHLALDRSKETNFVATCQ